MRQRRWRSARQGSRAAKCLQPAVVILHLASPGFCWADVFRLSSVDDGSARRLLAWLRRRASSPHRFCRKHLSQDALAKESASFLLGRLRKGRRGGVRSLSHCSAELFCGARVAGNAITAPQGSVVTLSERLRELCSLIADASTLKMLLSPWATSAFIRVIWRRQGSKARAAACACQAAAPVAASNSRGGGCSGRARILLSPGQSSPSVASQSSAQAYDAGEEQRLLRGVAGRQPCCEATNLLSYRDVNGRGKSGKKINRTSEGVAEPTPRSPSGRKRASRPYPSTPIK